jgi:hypothetical protein
MIQKPKSQPKPKKSLNDYVGEFDENPEADEEIIIEEKLKD